ncbi:uncharacterized protein F4822DRAFT_408814 [Hypoxylon trugodes]|uniref:uncharacterized protein n=1 Tax=Hypoxylon trugodes TaxID=326681 RepID=UPI002191EC70|nr:uncharacterized protein F4822DRAFT_408814 [Hypoxylon trugodes]KAI1386046.1 hypothetical protein F4822DRAFT_408814 [Hypoxylon trugodes]
MSLLNVHKENLWADSGRILLLVCKLLCVNSSACLNLSFTGTIFASGSLRLEMGHSDTLLFRCWIITNTSLDKEIN